MPVASPSWRDGDATHLRFLAAELVLFLLAAALAVVAKRHPGPLLGDVGLELDVQHALLPHAVLRDPIEAISALHFTTPTTITLLVIVAIFLLLRRLLDAIVVPLAAGVESITRLPLLDWVHRPRPSGYGIQVLQILHSYGFPSGHVTYATTVYGLFLFLTFQVRDAFHPALIWAFRFVLVLLILIMPVSRVLEGEHWPSDTLGGLLFGLFWLILFAHVYLWMRSRWPSLLARDERLPWASGR